VIFSSSLRQHRILRLFFSCVKPNRWQAPLRKGYCAGRTALERVARLAVYEVTETARLEVERAVHVVQAPVAGRVLATHAQLGQAVERGTVLVELDSATEQLRAEEARSQLDTLAHQIQTLNIEINDATEALQASQLASHIALEEARAHLRQAQDAKRAQGLHNRGYLSEADWQRAHAQAEQEHAARERLRLAVSRL
jgi:multidrug resistance efflux pump